MSVVESSSQTEVDGASMETLFQLSTNLRERRTQPIEGSEVVTEEADKVDAQSLKMSAIIVKGLRDMYADDKARFKSIQQAEATRETLKRDSDLLVILPTGGGKTLVYLLPIFIERDMTTVVVVPFVALVDQVEEQCKGVGLSCQIWEREGFSSGKTQVIIVGVENAILAEFHNVLIQLESTNRLARIVIDECHTLVSQRDFRPIMRRLGGLVRCVTRQLVLLTATLPPSLEDGVRVNLGCESLKVIRRIEDRKELKYSVRMIGNDVKTMEGLNREIGLHIKGVINGWVRGDRGLIYCLQTKWALELAKYLNARFGREVCGIYNAKMGKDERKKALKDWKSGLIKLLATTSALGAGLDYGQVRLVIHQGRGGNLLDYSQESGRGGRDGRRAECITFFWEKLEKETGWMADEGKKEMVEWIKSDKCWKKSLSEYLHGSGWDCLSQRDGEICGNCEKSLEGKLDWNLLSKKGVKRGRELQILETMDGVELKEMIEELKGSCTLCWVEKKEVVKWHQLPRCKYD